MGTVDGGLIDDRDREDRLACHPEICHSMVTLRAVSGIVERKDNDKVVL